ncbi:MAG: CheA signal transduction histidine kinase [Sphingomonas bacterium]|nr:response regulator [Sphingomonas bacterium]MDB5688383.1 CheA signal transduction histidine kinase [Sphingomonas bacterium]
MDDLTADFIIELRQLLEATAGDIADWAESPDDPRRIDAIFRLVHRIKGSSGAAGLPRLVRLAHAVEDVLAAVRAARRAADPELVTCVRALLDRIDEVAAAMASGEGLDAAEDDRLLASVRGGTPLDPATPAGPAEPAPPRTIRLNVDLVDRLMRVAAGLATARDRLGRDLGTPGAAAAFAALSAGIDEMDAAISGTRVQRLDHLFAALPRMVRELAGELGREVVLEMAGGEIELDRDLIAAIRDPLVHIVRNAVDHGIALPEVRRAAGKPSAGTLHVSGRIENNQIVLEAADDGNGIDADRVAAQAIAAGILTPLQVARLSRSRRLALIFTPGLSTAPAVTTVSGRGVGLDVVRTGIENAGGTVEIETEAGVGTRVRLKLPLRAASVAPAPITAVAPVPAPPVRKTCLVVDDSRVVRTVARYMLEGLDFTVEEAVDGEDGLDRCRDMHPDVILLDRNMPGMDGIAFLREIGRGGFGQRPKILFCTADNDAASLREAMAAGADALVLKPFDRQTLHAQLAAVGAA